MTILIGYNLPGLDLNSTVLANYTLCCNWCLSYSGCVAFTWGLPTDGVYAYGCYVKNGVPSSSANSATVSAHF